MDIISFSNVKIDAASSALLKDIEETARKVNGFRPLSPEAVAAVQNELLGERVYSSNAIEGNTLDLRETIEILKTGQITLSKKREATEAINLGKAIEFAQFNGAKQADTANEQFLLDTHVILLQGIRDDWAGHYRNGDVMIRGAKHQPPPHNAVPELMEKVLSTIRDTSNTDPIIFASWVHWAISRIHPFHDGNGRIARLWQDLILFRNDLTCAIIKPADRGDYLTALTGADDGDLNPLIQLIGQRSLATLDKYLVAKQRLDAMTGWASTLAHEANARAAENRKLEYLRWTRKMEEIRFAFSQCASIITRASADIEVQVRPFDIIDETIWENIRLGNAASKTWFFKLLFRRQKTYRTYIFFFEKHFWSDADTDEDRAEPRVCLTISEQTPVSAVRLADLPACPLSLRGLFVTKTTLVKKRWDPQLKLLQYDRGVDSLIVAQEFISDVLLLGFQ